MLADRWRGQNRRMRFMPRNRRGRRLLRRYAREKEGRGRGRQSVYTLCRSPGTGPDLLRRHDAKTGNGKATSVKQPRPLASILAKGTSKDTMPTVRGRLWAAGAT
jgi:hypothetical protein